MSESFTIAQLAEEFGITHRAVRFYEQEGLLAPARRGNRRVYTPGDRVRLKLILRGRRLGFSISEIREILSLYDSEGGEGAQLRHLVGKIRERRATLRQQRADIDAILDELDRLEGACTDRLLDAAD
ncbi:MAG: MerR family DNA-binding transcriptional regulator [Oceanibaculum nanhaiense]|uniref:MerR family transcriptional regulator n=1 Tax=Oceanibaculum nanhaiense TaxID=1909734 RepID=UPI0025A466EC|nr:MerR family DNA-binding transcriptional regulator [Oceanibaculum nanhaiense]MDM7946131.1 MerR family DNA-binding transcriptional regulator [Oceanibaculum nanhaiense]